MIDSKTKEILLAEIEGIKEKGLWKEERVITSPQSSKISVTGNDNHHVLNLCANNYLGLSNHPDVIKSAKASYEQWGYGLSSVRFICGTQSVHKLLEGRISAFLGTEDTILYSSCFDANTGFFETILNTQDAIFSDELNHASIIDGVRLCKAARYRYKNNNMEELEKQLKGAKNARIRLIVTDGVFSMDGIMANLPGICKLAEAYQALVMVDDSHAVGFIGEHGRGTPEYFGCADKVDIVTGTLGKAMGGASGGYTSGRKEIIALLRQRSRPYLFSNTLSPAIAQASLKVLDMISQSDVFRKKLMENTRYFRKGMTDAGFDVGDSIHPIVPVILGDAHVVQEMSRRMLEKGVYVVGFFYPVVPHGKARIRTQISAAHTREDLDFAIEAFTKTKEEMGLG